MKILQSTTLLALVLLASCGGGSGSAPESSAKKTEVVNSAQSVSYVEELRALERSLITQLLSSQDFYASGHAYLERDQKISMIKAFERDQKDLQLVEDEIKRAIELEKIQTMTKDDVLARFSDRLEDIIVVSDAGLDLIELHQSVMKLDPVVDDLIGQKSIQSLESADRLSSNLTVYQSGPFIYVR